MSPRWLAGSLAVHAVLFALLPPLRMADASTRFTALAFGGIVTRPAGEAHATEVPPEPPAEEETPPAPQDAPSEASPEPAAPEPAAPDDWGPAGESLPSPPVREIRPPAPAPSIPPGLGEIAPLPFRYVHHQWVQDVYARVRGRLAYPDLALANRWEGRVRVAFRLRPDGTLATVRVAEGSRFLSLDAAVEGAVRGAGPFPPPPEGVPESFLSFERIYVFALSNE